MHELIRSRSAVASFSLRTCLLAIFLAAGARLSALTTPSTGAIAVGNNHVLYLKPDGTVWAWGFNSTGQLGDGTTTDRATPVQVSGLSDVVAVAVNGQMSAVLKSDGTVWAWGNNGAGQLGDGTTINRSTPAPISGLSGITAISGGNATVFALKSDGTVWGWGLNLNGRLGDGTTTDRLTPVPVSGLGGIVAISVGVNHGVALKSDGTVWAWGLNAWGQLGDGTTDERHTPVLSIGISDVSAVSAGANFTLALKTDGTVWAWGNNSHGALGDGTTINRTSAVQVSGLAGVTANGPSSGACSLAIRSDGTVWGWGQNDFGQVGDGTTTDRLTPVQVGGLTGVVAVSTHPRMSGAIKADGTVWMWGQNPIGSLGDGTTAPSYTPIQPIFGVTTSIGLIASQGLVSGGATGLTLAAGGTNQNITLMPSGTGKTIIGGNGGLTGGSSGLTLNAGGANQNVTLTPSGTGNTILNGNIGIGTTTPSSKLTVQNGHMTLSGNSYFTPADLLIADTNTHGHTWRLGEGFTADNGALHVKDDTSGQIRMTWDVAGNVGIGTATPAATLDIAGTANVSSDLSVGGALSATALTATAGSISGGATSLTLNAGGANQNVTLTPSGTGNTILNGNIGIGTTTPSSKLTVQNGHMTLSGNSYFTPADLLIADTNTSGHTWRLGEGFTADNGALHLKDDTSGQIRMTWDVAGNVGIGTATPAATLDVAGSANVSSSLSVGGTLSAASLQIAGQPFNPANYLQQSGGTVTGTLSATALTATAGSISGGATGLTLSAGGANQNITLIPNGTGNTIIGGNGGLTGSSSGLGLNAGGSNQNVTITPSGTGSTVINGNLGISNGGIDLIASGSGSQRVRAFRALNVGNNTLQIDQFGGGHATRPSWNIIGVSDGSQGLGLVTDNGPAIDSGTSLQGLFIKSGGNVGIGTVNPNFNLDVAGSANVSSSLSVGGTLSAASLQIAGQPFNPANYVQQSGGTVTGTLSATALTATAGSISGGATGLTLSAGGSGNQNITLTPTGAGNTILNGNVGVGSATPNAKLHLVAAGQSGATTAFQVDNSANVAKFKVLDNGTVVINGPGNGTGGTSLQMNQAGGGPASFIFLDNGRFAMGIGTSAPVGNLDITDAATATLNLNGFNGNGGIPGTVNLGPATILSQRNASGDTHYGSLIFKTTDAGGLVEAMRITSLGSVGIGTATPTAKLDVNGSFNAQSLSIAGQPFNPANYVQQSGGTVTGTLSATALTATAGSISGGATGLTLNAGGSGNQNITLAPTGAGNTILNGKVGIGTATPGTKLHIHQTGQNSSREYFENLTLSDDANALGGLANGTSVDGIFVPTFFGYRNGTVNTVAAQIWGIISSTGDIAGNVPLVYINAATTSSPTDPLNGTFSSVANRNLLGVANSGVSLLTVAASGRVGIGTASPAVKLDVVGNANISTDLAVGGTLNTASLQIGGVSFVPANYVAISGSYPNPAWLTSLSAAKLTTGTLPASAMPAYTGDVTASAGSTALTLANSGATAGTYSKVTVDAKGRVTAGASLAPSDVTNALTYTPYDATNPAGYITAAGLPSVSVQSVFGRTGAVLLQSSDVTGALGYAPVTPAGGTFTGNVKLAAGTTAAPPLSLQAGTNLSTPVFGAVEFDGTNLFVTNNSASPTRKTLAYAATTLAGYGITDPVVVTSNTYADPSWLTALSAAKLTTGTLPASAMPAHTGDVTSSAGSSTLTLAPSGVAAGTYSKVTVDAKGRVTTGASIALVDITNALTYTPVNKAGDTMTGALSATALTATAGAVTAKSTGDALVGTGSGSWVGLYLQNDNYAAGTYNRVATDSLGGLAINHNGTDLFYVGRSGSPNAWFSGAVGIGTTPGSMLHLRGAAGTYAPIPGGGTLYLQDSGGAPSNGGALVLGAAQGYFAGIKALMNDGTQNTVGDLAVYTRNSYSDANLTERVRVAQNGNVGIGTPIPAAKLDVSGNANISTDLTVGGTLTVATKVVDPTKLVLNSSYYSDPAWIASLSADKLTSGMIPGARMPAFSGDVSSAVGTTSLALATVGTAGTYFKVTVDAKGRVLSGESLKFAHVTSALGYTPYDASNPSNYINAAGAPVQSVFGRGGSVTMTATDITAAAQNGSVGIGTLDPKAKLHVNGTAILGGGNIDPAIYPTLSFLAASQALLIGWNRSAAYGETDFISNRWGSPGGVLPGGFRFITYSDTGDENTLMTIWGDTGKVGIGTIDPGNYKLAVNGAIHAKEVVVDTTNWSDYVFAPDYRLPTLSEVEAHIKTEKHLPGIPSAQEVADHGIGVGEMQAKLLAKIEELTLHMIEQEKRIQRLENENATLRDSR